MFAQQRLYLTADKSRLVPEGDDEAATLYASPGDEIPDSAVEKFGLVDGALPGPKKGKTVKSQGESKEAKTGATKEAQVGENKAGGNTSGGPASAAGDQAE